MIEMADSFHPHIGELLEKTSGSGQHDPKPNITPHIISQIIDEARILATPTDPNRYEKLSFMEHIQQAWENNELFPIVAWVINNIEYAKGHQSDIEALPHWENILNALVDSKIPLFDHSPLQNPTDNQEVQNMLNTFSPCGQEVLENILAYRHALDKNETQADTHFVLYQSNLTVLLYDCR